MNENSTLIILVNQIKSEVLKSAVAELPGRDFISSEKCCYCAPPERSVKALLGYARSLEVADSESLGKIEWVLN